ncbi:hypothetical protein SAMN05421664_1109 [Chryseobacterium soldanellicola]|uniref:Lipoprotein n=1 Tax=Chryseobacterium soldanellicola TaxID=311333 RepID=A0A1H0ZW63_9FLAO|nr:hypothetical protein [Chryseobacterium soldanellicola]SDQ31602.1 hypothetical protein SAMN05421664_1109 [Chryseobacterium soldanellicola]
MRKITQGLLIALLASCSNPKSDSATTDQKDTSASEMSTPSTSPIAGNWVSDQYVENVKKTKSVFQNKIYGTKVLFFSLNENELQTGSATLHGFTDHEGGSDVAITFDKEKNEFVKDDSKKTDDPTFKDSFEAKLNSQNKLEMYFPKTKKTETYQKLSTDLDTELRKILIAGSYTDKDSKSKIDFSADGKVNFEGYKSYKVIYDFTTGPGFDGIIFYKSDQKNTNGDVYQFKIIANTLELQLMKGNDKNPNYTPSGKKYILTK